MEITQLVIWEIVILGFVLLVIDVKYVLFMKNYKLYIILQIALMVYIKQFTLTVIIIYGLIFKIGLQYIFNVEMKSYLLTALLTTAILQFARYLYIVIFPDDVDKDDLE